MRAKISGIAVALAFLAAFCWLGSPLRPYTVTYWFRHSFYILYINHFVFYLLASLAAGFWHGLAGPPQRATSPCSLTRRSR